MCWKASSSCGIGIGGSRSGSGNSSSSVVGSCTKCQRLWSALGPKFRIVAVARVASPAQPKTCDIQRSLDFTMRVYCNVGRSAVICTCHPSEYFRCSLFFGLRRGWALQQNSFRIRCSLVVFCSRLRHFWTHSVLVAVCT